jgi:hypothetical protein
MSDALGQDCGAVASGESVPDLAALEDGCLYELAVRHGVTIAEVRRWAPSRRGAEATLANDPRSP